MSGICWAVLTGEYPPQVGGVADYTALLAGALSRAGDEVHVWAPEPCRLENGATIHPLPDCFGPRSLVMLDQALSRLPPDHRLLVQYVPHAFGWRAMNLPFCIWLACRRKKNHIWVMFHEVSVPELKNETLRYKILRLTHQLMARLVVESAERMFISIPGWRDRLVRLTGLERPTIDLAVPSNLPTTVDPGAVAQVRQKIARQPDTFLFGYFGTCQPNVQEGLTPVLLELLARHPSSMAVLIGPTLIEFSSKLVMERPELKERICSPGHLPGDQAVVYLSTCDLLLYPFPDGVSGRRGSLMASLALGLPILTTAGFLTEQFWRDSQAVALVEPFTPEAMVALAEDLMLDKDRRSALSVRARAFYQERFSIERIVAILRG